MLYFLKQRLRAQLQERRYCFSRFVIASVLLRTHLVWAIEANIRCAEAFSNFVLTEYVRLHRKLTATSPETRNHGQRNTEKSRLPHHFQNSYSSSRHVCFPPCSYPCLSPPTWSRLWVYLAWFTFDLCSRDQFQYSVSVRSLLFCRRPFGKIVSTKPNRILTEI